MNQFTQLSRSTFIARAKGVFHCQLQRGAEAHGLAVECGLDLGEDVLVAAVQVRQVTGIQRLALGRGDLVGDGDGGVFGDGGGHRGLALSAR